MIVTVLQTQVNLYLSFNKINTFSAVPTLLIILSVGPSPDTKKLFLRLLEWDDEQLSMPKNYNIPSKVINQKIKLKIKPSCITTIHILIFITFLLY